MSDLNAEDYDSIHAAGRMLYEQGWRQAFTLNQMFNAWAGLVAEIERGYDQLVDEYSNDLSCRDWLAAAWPLLTERVQAARQAELDGLDHRFRAATHDDNLHALGRYVNLEHKSGWWWRRLPTRRVGQFAADLADP